MKISYDSVFHGKELGVNKVRSGPKEKLREGSEERKKKEAICLSFEERGIKIHLIKCVHLVFMQAAKTLIKEQYNSMLLQRTGCALSLDDMHLQDHN